MTAPADIAAARAFAEDWVAAWNRHDLERILSHYAEDVVFRSRKAARLVGTGTVKGKAALRDYWSKALAGQPDLKFTLGAVYLGHEMVTLAYRNQRGIEATETFQFGADGRVIRSAACHAD
jgi:ketosteroid isomerase-like protein